MKASLQFLAFIMMFSTGVARSQVPASQPPVSQSIADSGDVSRSAFSLADSNNLPILVRNASISISSDERYWPSYVQGFGPATAESVTGNYVVSVPAKGLTTTLLETKTRTITLTKQQTFAFQIPRLQFMNASGDKLATEKAIELINEYQAFLLPGTEAAIDASVLKLYNKNLVVVIPNRFDRERHGLQTVSEEEAEEAPSKTSDKKDDAIEVKND